MLWMAARRESAGLAKELIRRISRIQEVDPQQLPIHSDRVGVTCLRRRRLGRQVIAYSLARLLPDLDVTKSHTQPHMPNDNPYSKA